MRDPLDRTLHGRMVTVGGGLPHESLEFAGLTGPCKGLGEEYPAGCEIDGQEPQRFQREECVCALCM